MFYYSYGNVDREAIAKFGGSHPAVMNAWLEAHANPSFRFNPEYRVTSREMKHRRLRKL